MNELKTFCVENLGKICANCKPNCHILLKCCLVVYFELLCTDDLLTFISICCMRWVVLSAELMISFYFIYFFQINESSVATEI